MRLFAARLGLPLMIVVAGCAPAGTGTAPTGPISSADEPGPFDRRATAVAEAWQPGPGWREGYVPLQDPAVLIGEANFTPATQTAFQAGWYRKPADLPVRQPDDGTIRFPDGQLRVPLVSATDAFLALTRGSDPPSCPGSKEPAIPPPPAPGGKPDDTVASRPQGECVALTISKVELGTAPLRTSRGEAQVPAWLFTVEEIGAVVAAAAVAPHAVDAVPEPVAPSDTAPEGLVAAQDIVEVDGTRLAFRLGVGSCDTDITPLVQERDDIVVVGGTVVRSTDVCDAMLRMEPVEVTLKEPLGARPVLDALTGAPLRIGGN
ncbi:MULTISPECIES: hypothetical protein [Micromonospora]|uniref:hypothetical protein n=1 Tax=Micromonospora TaxID=1873 RepID=UPI000F87E089|nr:hypothetical protein [Verrucosispora sp. FIM060022]RUL93247.1 hypothetical protein EG812_12890 [Verrucosispora sp. FIM060022]